MKNYEGSEIVNIGTGEELTIKELALLTKKVIGIKGKIVFDSSKPNGIPRKLSDVSKIHSLDWRHKIELGKGISETYEWYKLNQIL